MRISVVTISFNQARFLRQAMDSVLAQAWPDTEYIVVDPGSGDGSRDIIDSYGDRVQVRVYERDQGAADGLNKGFAHATGEILCFLNSDDDFLPGAFENMARALQAHPEADFVSGCGWFTDDQGRRGRRIVPTRLSINDYVYGSSTVFQQGTFFRRHCFERVKGFNVANRTSWDGELFLDFLRAGLRHEVVYDDVANFRIYGESITGSGRLMQAYLQDAQRMFAAAKGRPRGGHDAVLSTIYRLTKMVRHPRCALERIKPILL